MNQTLWEPGPTAKESFQAMPTANPATTSLAQCARTATRVSERPTARVRTTRRGPTGRAPAADASAPMCRAWPEGKASSRLPENEIPWRWPTTVLRSGRVWSKIRFMPWGSNDAAAATSTAWLEARRRGSPAPREASQPIAVKASSTFSSAPQVRARASFSGGPLVLRATVCAMATSALVGRIVTGKRRSSNVCRSGRNLAAIGMVQRIQERGVLTHVRPRGSSICHNGTPPEG
jgi:hypothetical protein